MGSDGLSSQVGPETSGPATYTSNQGGAGDTGVCRAPSAGQRMRPNLRSASFADGEAMLRPGGGCPPGAPAGGPASAASPAQAAPRPLSPSEAGSARNFAEVQANTNFRRFMRSLEEMRPGGTGDQVTLVTEQGSERICNRGEAERIRLGTRRELDRRVSQLESMLAGAAGAMQVLRSNNQDATNPIDFPRLERAFAQAQATVRALRSALSAGRFSVVSERLGQGGAQCRSVERQVEAIREDTVVAECTAYGLELVRDTSLAIFAVAAVAATGGVAGAVLTAGATMAVEGSQQMAEVGNGLRSEVSGREILVRGALAGLSTLASAAAADIVASAGGRMLVADIEAILVRQGFSPERASALAAWGVKKVVKYVLDLCRSRNHVGSSDIEASTGVAARTSDTRIPAGINATAREHLPAPTASGDNPFDSAFSYIQSVDYAEFVRSQATTWARDQATGAADVAGQTPARPNVSDAVTSAGGAR